MVASQAAPAPAVAVGGSGASNWKARRGSTKNTPANASSTSRLAEIAALAWLQAWLLLNFIPVFLIWPQAMPGQ